MGRFTLIVGPNGSGKSTALWALRAAGNTGLLDFNKIGFYADATLVQLKRRYFRDRTYGREHSGFSSSGMYMVQIARPAR